MTVASRVAEKENSNDAVVQRESAEGGNQSDVVILTQNTTVVRMIGALAKMQALPSVLATIVRLRKEELA